MKKFAVLLSVLILMSTAGGCGISSVQPSSNRPGNASAEIKIDEGAAVEEASEEVSQEAASGKAENEQLDKYFSGFDGCFVLFDQNNNEYTVYNETKSMKEISPCSTFKIVHSLIGLETGVLQDENTAFKWDGTKYSINSWNKDQTLSTAVSNSVVWYFKKVASKVGEDKMQNFLDQINYGNKDISAGITQFWIQASLKISPRQQVEILKDFYNYKLPFSTANVDIVKKIIRLSDQDNTVLSGKTGSGVIDGRGVNGWFVGYVERNNNVFFFATNIEAKDNASGSKAQEITLQILKEKNILQ